MTNKEILQADMLDILFEHRNKLYGAYALRKTYSKRLGTALAAALSLVLLFILMSFINKNKKNNSLGKNDSMVIIKTIEIPKDKPKEPEPPREKPKPQMAQADYQKIVVVPDDKADTMIVDMKTVSESQVGNSNTDGKPDDGLAKTSTETNVNGNQSQKETKPEKDFVIDERPPVFPGGTQAWLAFLQRYLQSPDDIEPGKRIEVQVRFWVDIDGNVSKPEIVKSGGAAFDKEVLRVMRKMPKWEPAIQNGNHIAVACTQPVIFVGVEE